MEGVGVGDKDGGVGWSGGVGGGWRRPGEQFAAIPTLPLETSNDRRTMNNIDATIHKEACPHVSLARGFRMAFVEFL